MNTLDDYRPCVGICLMNDEGRIFAGKRIDTPGEAWQMPQGGVDKGESEESAAFRELFEETGVRKDDVRFVAATKNWLTYDLPPAIQKTIWGGKYKGQKQRWFLFRFEGDETVIDITQPPAEFSEWAWQTPELLIEKIVPFKHEIYNAVFDEFRPYIDAASS